MTPHESTGEPAELDPQDRALLSAAAGALRAHSDPRWVEVSSRVLNTALRATRRSQPVRALAPGGPIRVSEQVIVAYLREALDGLVPGTAVAGIHLDITGRDTYTGVLIELIVQYGTAILPVADRIRAQAATVLEELLGPAATGIHLRTSHIHVSDVTVGDPQTAEPASQPLPFT